MTYLNQIRLNNQSLILLVAILFVFLGLLGGNVWLEYRHVTDRAKLEASQLTQLLAFDVNDLFRNVDEVQQALERLLPEPGQELAGGASVNEWLRAFADSITGLEVLNIFDADGVLRHSSADGLEAVSVADREHFRVLRENRDQQISFSGLLTARTTGKPSLFQLHALRDEQGQFLGAVGAVINPQWFDNLHQVGMAPGGVALLRRSDTTALIARYPRYAEADFNRPLPPDNPIRQRVLTGDRSGSLRYTASTDGLRRIGSFHVLEDYPFYVQVAVSEAHALAGWWHHVWQVSVLAALLVLAAALALRRWWQTQQIEQAALVRQKLAERRSLELLERLRKLTAHLPGCVYQSQLWPDGSKAFVYASAGIRNIYGVTPEKAQADADSVFELLHADDVEPIVESIRISAETLTPWHQTYRINHPQKGLIWVEGHAIPERLADGSIIWHGYTYDVTERKVAEQKLRESKAQLDLFFSQSLTGFFFTMLDEPVAWNKASEEEKETLLDYIMAHQRMTKVNQALLDQYGAEEGELIGLTPNDLFAHDLEQCRSILKDLLDQGRCYRESQEQRLDGTPIIIDGDYICLYDEQGRVTGYCGVQDDITTRKHAEQAVKEARILLQAALESSPSGILIANAPDGRIRFANRAALAIWNTNAASDVELLDSDFSQYAAYWQFLQQPDGTPMPLEKLPLYRAITGGESIQDEELLIADVAGTQRWLSLSAAPIRNEEGEITAGIGVFADITQQKQTQLQLQRSAHYDALTGLPNRVLLADRLDQAIAGVQRTGHRLAVAFIDLDNFKPVNDEHGHATGDALLMAIAERMRRSLRSVDTLARLGGDEFVAVLSNLAEHSDAQPLIQRLLKAVSAPLDINGIKLQVTGSIGITFYPQATELDPDQLLRQADQAMYQAKLKGRNTWHCFEPGNGALHDHHASSASFLTRQ